jgi:signal transduction histidine kinase
MKSDTVWGSRFKLLSAICGFVAVAAGALALAGWISGFLFLAGLASDRIPMAPNTALFFIFYGSAILLRVFLPQSRPAWWTGMLINMAGGVLALLLLVLSSLGIHPVIEHTGIVISGTLGAIPLGHMSPVTAFCFVIASLSFLGSASVPPGRNRRATAAWWLSALLLAINAILFLAYLYGSPLLYGGTLIPPAATTIAAFIALGMALLTFSAPWAGLPYRLNGTEKSAIRLLIGVFVMLACGIMVAGYLYFHHYEERYRLEAESRLSAIAEMKVAELVLWRKERQGDGAVIQGNPAFSALVRRLFSNSGDRAAARELNAWISRIQDAYKYDKVFLLDTRNAERISSSTVREPVSPYLAHNASEALRSGEVMFVDFHRHDKDDPIYLSVIVPIFDGTEGRRALGVLVLRIDPGRYLYPFISRWPTPSSSAETILVRRDGDEVVFLNELRFDRKAPLSIRFPLTHKELVSVKAIFGREEVVDGIDYRGVPVVAALRSVPDSPWFLYAKMDKAEIYAPLRERRWFVILLVASLLIGAGAGVGLLWREQSSAFYKEKVRVEQERLESERKFRTLFETMTEGVALHEMIYAGAEPVDYRLTIVNPAFERLTGIAVEKAEGALASALFGAGTPPYLNEYAQVARSGEPMIFETFFSPLEKYFHIAANSLGPGLIASFFEDITERKRQERELQEKNAELERFAYTVSHDLKSPLVTVKTFLGYLEQDLQDSDEDRVRQDIGYMHTAADKMGRLLDELLEMSRVGRLVNLPVKVSFCELVADALSAVAGSIAESRAEVKVDEAAITLYGDRQRLAEIWQNLIENAVKYMGDQKSPRIMVGAETHGKETIFSVRDNGIGIDPRYVEKIFGLFEKLDPKTEGTGLGLALIKRIVSMYHGAIWVESDGVGKGSCFLFTLPGAVNVTGKGEDA